MDPKDLEHHEGTFASNPATSVAGKVLAGAFGAMASGALGGLASSALAPASGDASNTKKAGTQGIDQPTLGMAMAGNATEYGLTALTTGLSTLPAEGTVTKTALEAAATGMASSALITSVRSVGHLVPYDFMSDILCLTRPSTLQRLRLVSRNAAEHNTSANRTERQSPPPSNRSLAPPASAEGEWGAEGQQQGTTRRVAEKKAQQGRLVVDAVIHNRAAFLEVSPDLNTTVPNGIPSRGPIPMNLLEIRNDGALLVKADKTLLVDRAGKTWEVSEDDTKLLMKGHAQSVYFLTRQDEQDSAVRTRDGKGFVDLPPLRISVEEVQRVSQGQSQDTNTNGQGAQNQSGPNQSNQSQGQDRVSMDRDDIDANKRFRDDDGGDAYLAGVGYVEDDDLAGQGYLEEDVENSYLELSGQGYVEDELAGYGYVDDEYYGY